MGKENVYTHTHTHTEEYCSAIKKNEILPSVTTWMDLEGIMLSEISQRETLHDFTYMWNLKNKTNEQTQQNRTRLIETGSCRGEGVGGE